MKCPKCKSKMIKGVEICPKCGMKVTSIETVSSKKKKSKKLWIIILIINGLAIIFILVTSLFLNHAAVLVAGIHCVEPVLRPGYLSLRYHKPELHE